MRQKDANFPIVLKIRSRERRGMGSNPIIGTVENGTSRGKFVETHEFGLCERPRMKTHESTVYLSTIRQVPARFRRNSCRWTDALPFGRLWYWGPNGVSNAVGGRIAWEGKRIRSNYSAFENPEEFGTILVERAFCLP